MLSVQVQYQDLQERKRHNITSEGIERFNAEEKARNNRVMEDIGWFNAYESQRHNQVNEDLGFQNLNEQVRHNMAQESIGRTQAAASMLQATSSAKLRNAQVKTETKKRKEMTHNIEKIDRERDRADAQSQQIIQEMGYRDQRNTRDWLDLIKPNIKFSR